MEKTLKEVQEGIVEDFSLYDEWLDKYEYLIELGKNLAPYPEEAKTDDRLIKGCQSRVWLNAELIDGHIQFSADSDAIIVKGIISMLVRVLNGHTPAEVLDADLYFIDRIGLAEHLSPTRSNGLLAMVKQIRAYALAFKVKEEL